MKTILGALLLALVATPACAQGLGSFANGLLNGMRTGADLDNERAQTELLEQQNKAIESQRARQAQQAAQQSEAAHRRHCAQTWARRVHDDPNHTYLNAAINANPTLVRWETQNPQRFNLFIRVAKVLAIQPAYVCSTYAETNAAAVAVVNELWPESTPNPWNPVAAGVGAQK